MVQRISNMLLTAWSQIPTNQSFPFSTEFLPPTRPSVCSRDITGGFVESERVLPNKREEAEAGAQAVARIPGKLLAKDFLLVEKPDNEKGQKESKCGPREI
jgi:hypothetical protein